MNPVEILGLRAIADKQASREIRNPQAVARTVAAAVTRIAAVAVEMAAVAGIGVAGKRANEELQ
jgi:hypothetical protein